MSIKKIITGALVLTSLVVSSQEEVAQDTLKPVQHEYKIVLNSGVLSKLAIKSDEDMSSGNYSFGLGMNYSYYLQPTYGVETGLILSSYRTSISAKDKIFTESQVDDTQEGFQLNVSLTDYKEQLSMYAVEVPIRFFYTNKNTKRKGAAFYGALGVKVVAPLVQSSNVSASDVTTEGFYPSSKLTFKDMESHGFKNWGGFNSSENPKLGATVCLTGSLGMYFASNKLYVGIYGDYGLLDMKNKSGDQKSILPYNPKGRPTALYGTSKLATTKSINLVNLGFQLKYVL